METLGHPTWVIGLRLKNIAAFALGKREAWGLINHSMMEDPWDYVHITCWNFLPFLLRRTGEAPVWVLNTVLCAWNALLLALSWTLLRLKKSLGQATQ